MRKHGPIEECCLGNGPSKGVRFATGTQWKRSITVKLCVIKVLFHFIYLFILKIWEQCFSKELKVDPKEHPILLTEHPNPSKPDREKMTQIILEKFDAPSVFLAFKPVLSLYAAGRYDGVVLQSGYGATHAVPCTNGNPLNKESIRLNLGGHDLDAFMKKLLEEKGTLIANIDSVVGLKESVCSVALNFDEQVGSSAPKVFKLPDGTEISITDEQFRCPEALFQPSLFGSDSPGIHCMLHNAVM